MNNKKISRLLSVIFSLTLVISLFAQVQTAAAASDSIEINASAAIAVEASTGKILYAKNADEMLPIASMAKMMTEYLVLEEIEEGNLSWDQTYKPSMYAYRISQTTDFSNVPFQQDAEYTVEELFEAMAIYSANSAAIGLAEMIAGSEAKFVDLMNGKAKELGLKNYSFVNATGLEIVDLEPYFQYLPEGDELSGEESKVSAHDMALLAKKLLENYPEVLDYASIPTKKFVEGTNMLNWNKMLPDVDHPIHSYSGVDGLKTGSTDSAGSSFTGTAEKNGMRVITVVMGATSDDPRYNNLHDPRFIETRKLLDYAYDNFTFEELFPKNYQVKNASTLEVDKGKEKEVEVHSKDAFKVPVKNGEEENYQAKFVIDEKLLNEDGQLTAPLKKGEKVGYMTVEYTGKAEDYGYLQESGNIEVITKAEVEKANWFILTMRSIGDFFGGLWNGIVDTVKGWF